MKFSEFAQLIAQYDCKNEAAPDFVLRLFDLIVDDAFLEGGRPYTRSSSTLRGYFNGTSDISGIARTISGNLDRAKFEKYVNGLGVDALERLWEALAPQLHTKKASELPMAIADLYASIVYEAAGKRPGRRATALVEDRLGVESALPRLSRGLGR